MVLSTPSQIILEAGDTAPDFELPGIDGKKYSLRDFRGAKALLVVFMCNHCPYVRLKISKLVQLQKDYGARGLRVVGINANDPAQSPDDSFENMKRFSKEKGINFPYLFDETQEVPYKFGAKCTPDPFLFNSKLKLAYHGRIDDAYKQEHEQAKTNELEEALRDVIAGKKVSVQTLPPMGCTIKWKNAPD